MNVMNGFKNYSVEEKEKYLDYLIERWSELNEELKDKIVKLPENLPDIQELEDKNYILIFDDNWDLETACKFIEFFSNSFPNASFGMLPPRMDLIEISNEEMAVLNNIRCRIKDVEAQNIYER